MNKIYNLISDGDLNDELSYCLRNRTLEQKFLYMNKGAGTYYDIVKIDSIYHETSIHKFFSEFAEKYIFIKDKNIAIVSLGCGNSEIETFIFENMKKDFNISYYGVDSSKNMLELSIHKMEHIKNIEKYFICADFSTNEFKRELTQLTTKSDERIFTFFSNTFGNIEPNNIIDILYNLLKTGEKIRLDIRLRSGTTTKDDLKDFEKYHRYLENKETISLFHNPIEEIHIDKKNGTFGLRSSKVEHLNAIKYQYNFIFNKKTSITIKNETITILPGEELKILNIYTYDPDGLINFFEGHNFKLINKSIKEGRGQFLFEKI
ncbi:L-histidine N(alpha)-methyltransferase [Candidatus Gracilibacteria bacterium]|nr:L-histidine N(alpha)-methyltransferase [Candidatus Gracilibacteria bacterium]